MKWGRRIPLAILTSLLIPMAGCSRGNTVDQVWIERWAEGKPMVQKRAGLGAVSHGRWIYAIGGGEYGSHGLRILDSVEYAEVSDAGRLGEWQITSSLKIPRIYVASAIYNEYLYAMGGEGLGTLFTGAPGETPPTLLDTVERAPIRSDGSLGEWTVERERMNYARRGGELFVHDGWLYAVGGFNGTLLRSIEKARIQSDGSLGEWSLEPHTTKSVRYISGFAQSGGRFYLFGGHLHSPEMALETVETAEVRPDFSLTEWRPSSPMNTRRFLGSSIRMNQTFYVIAGQNTVSLTSTERAAIQEDGSLGPFQRDTPVNVPRRAAGAVGLGDAIYVLGGMNGPIGQPSPVESVEIAYVRPGKGLGHWVEEGSLEHRSYETWKDSPPLDSQAHLAQALDLLPTGRFETVLYNTSEAIRIHPGNYQAYNVRGDAYFRMGRTDLAIDVLKRSLEIEEKNLDALIALGNISLDQGQSGEAIDYFWAAVEAWPESIPAHEQLGKAYLKRGLYLEAAREFEWILKKDPGSPEISRLHSISLDYLERKREN